TDACTRGRCVGCAASSELGCGARGGFERRSSSLAGYQTRREQIDRVSQTLESALFAERRQHGKQRRCLGLAADCHADRHEKRPGLPLTKREFCLEGCLHAVGGEVVEWA